MACVTPKFFGANLVTNCGTQATTYRLTESSGMPASRSRRQNDREGARTAPSLTMSPNILTSGAMAGFGSGLDQSAAPTRSSHAVVLSMTVPDLLIHVQINQFG